MSRSTPAASMSFAAARSGRMIENVAGGAGRLIPKPVTDPALRARNREALHRLVDIAVGRHDNQPADQGP